MHKSNAESDHMFYILQEVAPQSCHWNLLWWSQRVVSKYREATKTHETKISSSSKISWMLIFLSFEFLELAYMYAQASSKTSFPSIVINIQFSAKLIVMQCTFLCAQVFSWIYCETFRFGFFIQFCFRSWRISVDVFGSFGTWFMERELTNLTAWVELLLWFWHIIANNKSCQKIVKLTMASLMNFSNGFLHLCAESRAAL